MALCMFQVGQATIAAGVTAPGYEYIPKARQGDTLAGMFQCERVLRARFMPLGTWSHAACQHAVLKQYTSVFGQDLSACTRTANVCFS